MAKQEKIVLSKSSVILIAVAIIMFLSGFIVGNFLKISVGLFSGLTTSGTTGSTRNTTQNQGSANITIPSYVSFKGSDSASVNVVEFGDYQCPFCERFFTQTESQILQNYVNTGKAKFYFMDFAFLGPDSLILGQGAWCADEQGQYYTYHDYIYSHQGTENTGWATADKLKTIVANITGINAQNFSTCLDSNKYQSRVQTLTQLGQSFGVSGTPTIFVGNAAKGYTQVVGAQPYSVFQDTINRYL